MNFPQLRVRTGFTSREVYGRPPEIFARLKEIGANTAACVDLNGTWGHVRWEKEAKKSGIQAAFGMEFRMADDPDAKFKPTAWAIAEDTKKFYTFTTSIMQGGKICTSELLRQAEGVIRFSGAALDFVTAFPEAFDAIDLQPSNLLLAHKSVGVARTTGLPLVLTSLNDYPAKDHVKFAYAWEVRDSVSARHICTVDEIREELKLVVSAKDFDAALQNTLAIEERLRGIKLQTAPLIHSDGSLLEECRKGQADRLARGHIKEWTQEYEDRLQEELMQIQTKEFDAYFMVVSDMIKFAKTKMLVGPARGSSSGSLVCFLIGITEIDPLVHKLMFQRFIDVSRGGFEYAKFTGFEGIPYESKSA